LVSSTDPVNLFKGRRDEVDKRAQIRDIE